MREIFEKIKQKLEDASWWTHQTYDEDGYGNDDSDEVVYLETALEIVDQVAEEYNNGWIPCSERIPEEYKEVLVCDEWGGFIVGVLTTDTTSNTGYVAETGTVIMYDCIAWQPLPAPYKKEV